MGASNKLLCKMLMLQALLVGTIGYGLGVGLTTIMGNFALSGGDMPFYFAPEILLISFSAILLICCFSALLGIRKIRSIDPAEVFRG